MHVQHQARKQRTATAYKGLGFEDKLGLVNTHQVGPILRPTSGNRPTSTKEHEA